MKISAGKQFTRFFDRFPALPLALGAIGGVLADCCSIFYLYFCLFLLALMIILRLRTSIWVGFTACFALTFVMAVFQTSKAPSKAFFDGVKHNWLGTVETIRVNDRSQRLVVDIDSPTVFRCNITIGDISPSLSVGDIVRFLGIIENHHKYEKVPELAYRTSDAFGEEVHMFVMSNDCTILGAENNYKNRFNKVRESISQAIYDSPLQAKTSRLLATSVLGGGDVGDDWRQAFRVTGLSHLLCVSGFHIALFASLIYLLLIPVQFGPRSMRLRWVLAAVAVWLYAFVCGLTPSVLRATIMVSVFCLAKASERDSSPLNSLFVAIFVVLFLNPANLFSIGFQLSVSAVLGIILFARKFNPFSLKRRWLYKCTNLFTVPLAAMLATAPVMLYHFHSLPLLSVPSNVIASLLFPTFIFSGLIAAVTCWIGFSWNFPALVCDTIAKCMEHLCIFASDTSRPMIQNVHLSSVSLTSMIICITLICLTFYLKPKALKLLCISFACFTAYCFLILNKPNYTHDIVIHGNSNGSELIVRHDSQATVVPFRNKKRYAGNVLNHCASKGIKPENIIKATTNFNHGYASRVGNVFKYGNHRYLIMGKDSIQSADTASTVILSPAFRGNLCTVLEKSKAKAIIICPDMPLKRARRYSEIADSVNIQVISLADSVIIQTFEPSTPNIELATFENL